MLSPTKCLLLLWPLKTWLQCQPRSPPAAAAAAAGSAPVPFAAGGCCPIAAAAAGPAGAAALPATAAPPDSPDPAAAAAPAPPEFENPAGAAPPMPMPLLPHTAAGLLLLLLLQRRSVESVEADTSAAAPAQRTQETALRWPFSTARGLRGARRSNRCTCTRVQVNVRWQEKDGQIHRRSVILCACKKRNTARGMWGASRSNRSHTSQTCVTQVRQVSHSQTGVIQVKHVSHKSNRCHTSQTGVTLVRRRTWCPALPTASMCAALGQYSRLHTRHHLQTHQQNNYTGPAATPQAP